MRFSSQLLRVGAFLLFVAVSSSVPAQLVINEIMYNPYEPWATTNDTEFVEIYNANPTQTVNLAGYRFDNGISYTFTNGTTIAPSSFLVICEDLEAFTNVYPGVANVVGNFGGGLGNGGERVTLSSYDGNQWVEVDSIDYVDIGESDGDGPSLELVNPGYHVMREHYAGAWSPSLPVLSSIGTPGASNSVFKADAGPIVGDVMHDPPFPPAYSAVKITCASRGLGKLAPELFVQYRKDDLDLTEQKNLNEWNITPMSDNGFSGDDVAEDHIYTSFVPTNGSLEQMEPNDVMQYRILAVDENGFTNLYPVESWSEVTNVGLSYLCKFGEDPAFTGDYLTYHVLMTEYDRSATGWGLDVRAISSPLKLDCTLVSSDGEVFYNCGIRLRGSTRKASTGPYRIELPENDPIDGWSSLNIAADQVWREYFGHAVSRRLGFGASGSEGKIIRLFFNQSLKGYHVQLEPVNISYAEKRNSGDGGNMYYSNGHGSGLGPFYQGHLDYSATLSTYMASGANGYGIRMVNTNTAYLELQELTRRLTFTDGAIATNIGEVIDHRQMARAYASFVSLDNNEAGMTCPRSTSGDELRIYSRPSDGRFRIYPWDFDDILTGANGWVWAWGGGSGGPNTRQFLFNLPTLPYYVGDCLDILTNTLNTAEFDEISAEMGPAFSLKPTFQSYLNSQLNLLKSRISTNFNVTVSGALSQGKLAAVVNSGTIQLSGQASQAYVQHVQVNGTKIPWTPWSKSAMQTGWGKWATNSFALSNTVNYLVVQEYGGRDDHKLGILRTIPLYVINRAAYNDKSGTISANTTWNGINVITGDVTVNNGATLTLDPGTVLLFAAGTRINVTSGALASNGDWDDPVYMLPNDGSSEWSIEANGATAAIDNMYTHMVGGYVASSASADVTLYRCKISDYTKNTFASSTLDIRECLFERIGECGAEISAMQPGSLISRSTFSESTGGASVDGLRFSGASSGVFSNCLVNGLSGTGVVMSVSASGLTATHNTIHDCAAGWDASNTSIENRNSTIDDCEVGLAGSAQQVVNAVVWSNAVPIISGPATVSNSDIQLAGTNVHAGTGNMNRNPWFNGEAVGDYRLQSVFSPCIGTADDGGDMGASFPAGANPAAPAMLNCTNVSGTQINITWADNSGDEEYFFEIERSPNGEDEWVRAGTAAANSTNFIDSGLTQDDSWYYCVRAMNDRGESSRSTVFLTRTGIDTTTQLLIDNLRITEIMYNSPYNVDGDLHDFIELKNIGGATLDMSGLYMTGFDFVFTNGTTIAPGEFFVLVYDEAAFAARYPGTNYHGVFAGGKLSDGGERVRVREPSVGETNTILNITYDDAWSSATDGNGYSLVLQDTVLDPDDSAAWRASSFELGSPGIDDPPSPYEGIVINELLTHTDNPLGDAIELFNSTASPIDVGGWFMSDQATNLTLYQIPPTTIVPAGGYYTFYSTTSFNLDANNGFAMHEHGDSVYLSSGAAGELTSFRGSRKFGAADNGVSFGSYYKSDGDEDFVAMDALSLDATNLLPKVGPVVISEIMYNPVDGGYEYIELVNVASTNVNLFDAAYAGSVSNTWKLDGAIEYLFDPDITIDVGETILIAETEPDIFRTAYNLTGSTVRIFGPFSGDLGNAGESVKLYKAGSQDEDGIPFILGDRVKYNDKAPWPYQADNDGPSLERKDLLAYGNDPTNWVAGSMGGTPGESNNVTGLPSIGYDDATGRTFESNVWKYASVTLGPAISEIVTVQYFVTGTAVPGSDYILSSGTLTFWPYETKKMIPIWVKDDSETGEYDETVQIFLVLPSANATLGGNRLFTLTIVDTDTAVIAPPGILADGKSITGTENYSFEGFTEIAMTSSVPGAAIYYNMYGVPPTTSDNLYTGAFEMTTSARISARTFKGSYHASAAAEATVLSLAPLLVLPSPLAVYVKIQNSDDDADQTAIGRDPVTMNAASIRMTDGVHKWSGFRFDGVGIVSNAVITNAYIQFSAYGVGSAAEPVIIFGEAADDALPYANAPEEDRPGSRDLTTSFVEWDPTVWSVADQRGPDQRTPDLSDIVNEIINRPGWITSNSIAFVMTNANLGVGGDLAPYSYDGSPSRAAEFVAVRFVEERTNFSLTIQTNGMGTVSNGNMWFDVAATATVSALPDTHYYFGGWSGHVPPGNKNDNPLSLIMNQDRTVQGVFLPYVVEAETNDVPMWWIAQYYPDETNVPLPMLVTDTDGDGMKGWQEYFADTDPTNAMSLLAVMETAPNGSDVDVIWPSSPDRYYRIYCSTNLTKTILGKDFAWADPPVGAAFGDASGTNRFTHSSPPWQPRKQLFYRIEAEIQ